MLVVLCVVALSINFTREQWRERAEQSRQARQLESEKQIAAQKAAQEQEQIQKENTAAAQQAAADAAAAHARYMVRYEDSGFVRKSGVETIALVAATENGTWNSAIGQALARRFQNHRVEMLPSFFKAEFISDGLFDQAFNGISDLSQKLELGKFLDGVVLAREQVSYSTNPSLDNVLTANMTLVVALLPVSTSVQSQTWTFTANGSGFSRKEARTQAEDRIVNQILKDAYLTLNTTP